MRHSTSFDRAMIQRRSLPVILKRTARESRRFGESRAEHVAFLCEISKMWPREPSFSTAQLGKSDIPATMALRQYDEAIARAHVEAIDAALPDSAMTILSNVSHFTMIQAPGEFNDAVLTFLKWR